jgi:hypothetical protein
MSINDLGYDETALAADLKTWWEEEGGGADDPLAAPKIPAGTIFDAVPAIDSLGVVAGLLAIEKHVPFKIPVRIIRRGGYDGFDDLKNDLIVKMRALAKHHYDKQAAKAGLKQKVPEAT